jgi:hypothetical protein
LPDIREDDVEEREPGQMELERVYLAVQTRLAPVPDLAWALALFEGRVLLDIAPEYDPEME